MSQHVTHRLTAYHDGALAPDESARIRDHLASCPACRLAHENHTQFEVLLEEAVQTPEAPAFMWTRVNAQLHKCEASGFSFQFAGQMAVAAVVGIALSFAVPTPSSSDSSSDSTAQDLWTTLDYGLVDGTPATLTAFSPQVSQ